MFRDRHKFRDFFTWGQHNEQGFELVSGLHWDPPNPWILPLCIYIYICIYVFCIKCIMYIYIYMCSGVRVGYSGGRKLQGLKRSGSHGLRVLRTRNQKPFSHQRMVHSPKLTWNRPPFKGTVVFIGPFLVSMLISGRVTSSGPIIHWVIPPYSNGYHKG